MLHVELFKGTKCSKEDAGHTDPAPSRYQGEINISNNTAALIHIFHTAFFEAIEGTMRAQTYDVDASVQHRTPATKQVLTWKFSS